MFEIRARVDRVWDHLSASQHTLECAEICDRGWMTGNLPAAAHLKYTALFHSACVPPFRRVYKSNAIYSPIVVLGGTAPREMLISVYCIGGYLQTDKQ